METKFRKVLKVVTYLFALIFLSTCDGNYRNVKVSGLVKSATEINKPISNVNVQVTAWVYSTENWQSNPEEAIISTNELGYFEVTFKRAEAIDILIEVEGYAVYHESSTLECNRIEFF